MPTTACLEGDDLHPMYLMLVGQAHVSSLILNEVLSSVMATAALVIITLVTTRSAYCHP